ncbi:MAG: hypothetical protein Kow0019_09540 [Methanobacteriaceae archaeon]
MNNKRMSLEELYYLLMSSWIYSIEKTRSELLGENIAYTKRIGWNATEYIMEHLKTRCDMDMGGESPLEIMKSIVNCLEEVGFIKKGTVTINSANDDVNINISGCGAEACKELLKKGIMPNVCLRSIILDTLFEMVTHGGYSYNLHADPEKQPSGVCVTTLKKI